MRSDPSRLPDRRPRVAVLCLHTSPLRQPGQGDAGGMNVYVRHLGAALAAAGHDVDLITLWRDAEHPGLPRPDTAVALSALDVPGPGTLRLVTVTLPATAAATKDELPDSLDEVAAALLDACPDPLPRPDLVHAHYWLSGAVGARLAEAWDAPLVLTLHTTARAKNARRGPEESPEPQRREHAEQRLVDRAAAVVVNTDAEAEELTRLYGAAPESLHEITPGVDLSVFSPRAPRTPRAVDGVTVGFAGRLQALKGPQILIEALGLLARRPSPPVRLVLAGTGDAQFTAALHESARRAGVAERIDWPGSLPVARLAQLMRSADLWAVPSSSETFGLVALEAQACGTPVLASRTGGLVRAVQDGRTGWLVAPRTPEAWAEAIRTALADREELARRGREAARRARGSSWAAAARRHVEDVYRPLLARRPTVDP